MATVTRTFTMTNAICRTSWQVTGVTAVQWNPTNPNSSIPSSSVPTATFSATSEGLLTANTPVGATNTQYMATISVRGYDSRRANYDQDIYNSWQLHPTGAAPGSWVDMSFDIYWCGPTACLSVPGSATVAQGGTSYQISPSNVVGNVTYQVVSSNNMSGATVNGSGGVSGTVNGTAPCCQTVIFTGSITVRVTDSRGNKWGGATCATATITINFSKSSTGGCCYGASCGCGGGCCTPPAPCYPTNCTCGGGGCVPCNPTVNCPCGGGPCGPCQDCGPCGGATPCASNCENACPPCGTCGGGPTPGTLNCSCE